MGGDKLLAFCYNTRNDLLLDRNAKSDNMLKICWGAESSHKQQVRAFLSVCSISQPQHSVLVVCLQHFITTALRFACLFAAFITAVPSLACLFAALHNSSTQFCQFYCSISPQQHPIFSVCLQQFTTGAPNSVSVFSISQQQHLILPVCLQHFTTSTINSACMFAALHNNSTQFCLSVCSSSQQHPTVLPVLAAFHNSNTQRCLSAYSMSQQQHLILPVCLQHFTTAAFNLSCLFAAVNSSSIPFSLFVSSVTAFLEKSNVV